MRYENIQVVRVVAAVAVVVAHVGIYSEQLFRVDAFPVHHGSWIALPVPIFFAVSGFVLTHVLQTVPTRRYLTERLLRVYPGFWIAGILSLYLVRLAWPESSRRILKFSWYWATLAPFGPEPIRNMLWVEWTLMYEVVLIVVLGLLARLGVRRGLPLAVTLWLAAIGVKVAVWPGYALDTLPKWDRMLISAHNVPFLLGVLAYYLRDRGRRWRWAVFAGLVAWLVFVPVRMPTPELVRCASAVGAAAGIWFVAQVRQVSPRNPLARLGDCTYGLYLLHAPVIFVACGIFVTRGWRADPGDVLVIGAAALGFGLLYGRFESWLHGRLRRLVRADVRGWLARVRLGWRGVARSKSSGV